MKKILALFLIALAGPLCGSTLNSNTSKVLVAAVQFPELRNQTEKDFISMVDNYIDAAQKKQVNIILFPELLTLNLLANDDHPTTEQWNEIVQFTNKYTNHLKSKAISSGLIIIGGTTLTEKNHKFYNTAIVAFPNGDIKTVDKSLLTHWELSNHITGIGTGQPLSFQTPWGTVVVLICYESESAEILTKVSKLNPNLIFIPSNTGGLAGLDRVSVASRYAAISQFAYTLLTGVTTKLPIEKVADNSVGQAIFATPQQPGYPLVGKYGTFNQPDLLIAEANIAKIQQDKLSPNSTFSARDYARQHQN